MLNVGVNPLKRGSLCLDFRLLKRSCNCLVLNWDFFFSNQWGSAIEVTIKILMELQCLSQMVKRILSLISHPWAGGIYFTNRECQEGVKEVSLKGGVDMWWTFQHCVGPFSANYGFAWTSINHVDRSKWTPWCPIYAYIRLLVAAIHHS